MSCELAALPFQAHANYETWSIEFDDIPNHCIKESYGEIMHMTISGYFPYNYM